MARFQMKVVAGGQVDDAELKEIVEAITIEGAKFIVGQRSEAPDKRSPLGRHFVRTNRRRYDWPELSPKYAAFKRRKFGKNLPIMVRTGDLRDAVLGDDTKITVTPGGAVIELTVPDHGVHHITGGPKLPRRDWTEPNDEDVQNVADFMDKLAQAHFDDLAVEPLTPVT